MNLLTVSFVLSLCLLVGCAPSSETPTPTNSAEPHKVNSSYHDMKWPVDGNPPVGRREAKSSLDNNRGESETSRGEDEQRQPSGNYIRVESGPRAGAVVEVGTGSESDTEARIREIQTARERSRQALRPGPS